MVFLEYLVGLIITLPILMLLVKNGKLSKGLQESYEDSEPIGAWIFIIAASIFYPLSIPMIIVFKLAEKLIKPKTN